MKKRFIRLISVVLTFLTIFSFTSVLSSASWLSPLAIEGDVSNNGIIQAQDARMILRAAAKVVKLVAPSRKWPKDRIYGDVNNDGKITSKDARIVLRRAAGLPDASVTVPEGTFNNEAEVFLSGKYHLVGKTSSADGFVDWNFATDGKNIYTTIDFEENKPLGFLLLNNRFYLLNPANKTYTEISKTLFGQMGIDIDDLSIELPDVSGAKLLKQEKIKEDGKNLDVLTYETDKDAYLKFYLDGTKLLKVETYAGTNLVGTMLIDSIKSDVSEVLATPSDYKKQSLPIFMLPLI